MGHTVGKDIYRNLGRKIDSLNVKVPWNQTFYEILKELYSPEEAALVANMPSGLCTAEELESYLKIDHPVLRKLLASLCNKGLVVDVFLNNNYYYCPSPLVIGIFEFTMMRMDNDLNIKKIAKLFHRYLNDETFYNANFNGKKKMGLMRTLPYEESLESNIAEDHVEVLDYEKATAIVEEADIFSISACSCRHEKLHARETEDFCSLHAPLDTCASFGYSADYLIRNNLAKKVSKNHMLDNIARSKELGLVLNADNVKNNCQFMCHCCKCCCNVLLGISKFGFPDTIVTSSFIVEPIEDLCTGCGKCTSACSVDALALTPYNNPSRPKKMKTIKVNNTFCLGCGVCVTQCPSHALKMTKRKQRVLHPESTFEKAILKHLESGNLQDQLFTNPKSLTQKVLRGIIGGFLRLPPVKRALMTDTLRSSFLNTMKKGARLQGKGWLIDI
jgi:ferredoxin